MTISGIASPPTQTLKSSIRVKDNTNAKYYQRIMSTQVVSSNYTNINSQRISVGFIYENIQANYNENR